MLDSWWIDWCNDGNILASGGYDKNVKFYDRRVGDVVKIFDDDLHDGNEQIEDCEIY